MFTTVMEHANIQVLVRKACRIWQMTEEQLRKDVAAPDSTASLAAVAVEAAGLAHALPDVADMDEMPLTQEYPEFPDAPADSASSAQCPSSPPKCARTRKGRIFELLLRAFGDPLLEPAAWLSAGCFAQPVGVKCWTHSQLQPASHASIILMAVTKHALCLALFVFSFASFL